MRSPMADKITLHLTLPRIPDIELVAMEGLERLARHYGIADIKVGEARLLVAEAVTNALDHTGDENPYVRVEFTLTPEELVIFVQDKGKGFDPSLVEDPDIDTKLHSPHKRGWGLKLMKSLSDQFQITSGSQGTTITIRKQLA
jgi:anti-sigma regulatory factor (Ser/Thr protein kinase)